MLNGNRLENYKILSFVLVLMCVPKNFDVKREILREAHCNAYSIHPSSNKMYSDMKQMYWWPGMICEISEFVAKCLICQQVKA
ncbi:DNA/RNA polymerases superfamily protein [Gossypium australe]|uniref:DNA/RNA polymerases superfamily protein n=1 Tax=Gossypium australe TaxID=47621 RepID=A0A5B6UVS6_9ROSI|nr:DNA/RNA polymerases superfamily protein [Gossypium australe]